MPLSSFYDVILQALFVADTLLIISLYVGKTESPIRKVVAKLILQTGAVLVCLLIALLFTIMLNFGNDELVRIHGLGDLWFVEGSLPLGIRIAGAVVGVILLATPIVFYVKKFAASQVKDRVAIKRLKKALKQRNRQYANLERRYDRDIERAEEKLNNYEELVRYLTQSSDVPREVREFVDASYDEFCR